MSVMTVQIRDPLKWSKELTQAITRETMDKIPEEHQMNSLWRTKKDLS